MRDYSVALYHLSKEFDFLHFLFRGGSVFKNQDDNHNLGACLHSEIHLDFHFLSVFKISL